MSHSPPPNLFVVFVSFVVPVVLTTAQQAPPPFRAAVDLIAVDVQVVDPDGRPIVDLAPEKFTVSIDGRKRRVVSVDLIRHQASAPSAGPPVPAMPVAPSNQWPPTGPVARTFVVAVDIGSLTVADSRGAAQAARAFIDRLGPNDLVGLYAYPLGPRLNPTFDRATVRRGLDQVVGNAQAVSSQYHLTPGEVVDIYAEMTALAARSVSQPPAARGGAAAVLGSESETLRRVMFRECLNDTDTRCLEDIEREAQAMAFYYESEMTRAVSGLRDLLELMSAYPGRKTVVLLSAGMPVSDRAGGRPSVGDGARLLGETAAKANATVYALHLDSTFFQSIAAENRRSTRGSGSRERDSVMMERFLDQFAGTSGGTLMRILVGSGEQALERILLETSSYYLVGVQTVDADRDGRTHRLGVTVDQPRATVRSRTWVHMPKKSS